MELAEEAVAPVDVRREHVEARVARDVRHREIAWRRRTREIVVDAFDQDAAMHRPRKRLDGARAKAMTPPRPGEKCERAHPMRPGERNACIRASSSSSARENARLRGLAPRT